MFKRNIKSNFSELDQAIEEASKLYHHTPPLRKQIISLLKLAGAFSLNN